MKKTIYSFALCVMMAGAALTSCDSKQDNVQDAKEDVAEAKEELKEAQRELHSEYPAYRRDMDARIQANQVEIDRLRNIVAKAGEKPLDNMRRDKIDELERKNNELRTRLTSYETERSDWESFKREFNRDMESMGNSFRDLGNDNTK